MQIVIDIPEERYEFIKELDNTCTDYQTTSVLYDAIRNGTVIPKGHGDLVDRRELLTKSEWFGESWTQDNPSPNGISAISEDAVMQAEAVIPADRGE